MRSMRAAPLLRRKRAVCRRPPRRILKRRRKRNSRNRPGIEPNCTCPHASLPFRPWLHREKPEEPNPNHRQEHNPGSRRGLITGSGVGVGIGAITAIATNSPTGVQNPGPRTYIQSWRIRSGLLLDPIRGGMDLPGEVLDAVLQRVPPRHLAACRRVCKSWRAVIDERGLVLAHLAPRRPHGIFINFLGKHSHSFFSRDVPTSPSIGVGGQLLFMPDSSRYCLYVMDHSNGLVLHAIADTMYVCNPLTRRWAVLPPPSVPFLYTRVYLMFDPAVSLHYHALYFPDVPKRPSLSHKRGRWTIEVNIQSLSPSSRSKYEHEVSTVGSMEWPPYSYAVQVFSSRTGQWQARHFTRQGIAALTVADVWSDPHAAKGWSPCRRHAVYWQGAFYLHCGNFVMRFSLLDNKYLVIKTPIMNNFLRGYFGKSKLGVCYTHVDEFKLSVWVLQESSDSTGRTLEWELRHQDDLEPTFKRYYNRHPGRDDIHKSWTLDPNEEDASKRGGNGWDSDDDNVTDAREEGVNSEESYRECSYGMDFMGYHPGKEILFLASGYNGFAYYLGTSKLQYLGSIYPSGSRTNIPSVAPRLESFIYTPCTDDLLPVHNYNDP